MMLVTTMKIPTKVMRFVERRLIRAAGGGGGPDIADIRMWIAGLIIGVVLLIAGTVAASITASIAAYILNALNSTGIIKASYNFVDSVISIISPIFTIIGVVLIVVSAVFIIRQLISMAQGLGI